MLSANTKPRIGAVILILRISIALTLHAFFRPVAGEILPAGHTPESLGLHALRGGTVMMRPGLVIEDGTILIRNGKIEAVGTGVEIPEHARVWDMTGLTIYPGFIDPFLTLKPSSNVLSFQSFDGFEAEERASGSSFLGVTGQEPDPGAPGPGASLAQITPERQMAEDYSHDAESLKGLREIGFTAGNVVPEKGVLRGLSAVHLP